MTEAHPTPENELEEAAQGHDLYRAPGSDAHLQDARDQAEASGWLPPDVIHDWPSPATHQAIVRRRQELHDALLALERSSGRSSRLDDWRAQLAAALESLSAALQRHVEETEADDGLFAEVIERSPNLASVVKTLREEHDELDSQIGQVASMVGSEADDSSLRDMANRIIGSLARHRQSGAELLFDVYNVDLATGD